MQIAVPHHTTRAKARVLVEQKLGALLGQFGQHAQEMEHEWTGDTLRFRGKAKGMKLDGSVDVTDSEVILDMKLPFMALPFEGRIKETAQKELAGMFRQA
jgi:hypothetical protein